MRLQFLAVITSALALALGLMAGYLIGVAHLSIPPTVLRPDTRPIVPVVRIDGVEDGQLTGTARGDVRLFFKEDLILLAASGSFKVPLGNSITTTASAPSGMHFVASKRGSKYYPVGSRSGEQLSPGNRIYFQTAAEAEAAGYRSGM